MKHFYFAILFIAGLSSFESGNPQLKTMDMERQLPPDDSLILWDSLRKLTWTDFQGKPDSLTKYKAMTSSWIQFNSEVFSDSIVLSIPCYFVKSKSWTISIEGSKLLKHEQLHFDIAELVARKIRKACSAHSSTSLKGSSKILRSYYDKYYGAYWDSLSNEYDSETEHGIVILKQKEWETKIVKELKALDAYSSTRVVIKRGKNK